MKGQWYTCKGCGQPCALLENGDVAHVKPKELIGVRGKVPCALYQACESRQFFLAHMAGDPIDPPDTMTPILG